MESPPISGGFFYIRTMRTLHIIFSVLLCCLPHLVEAQERAKIQFQEYSAGLGSFFQTIPVATLPMDGEIYPNPEFTPAMILLYDSTVIVGAPLRYNVLKQKAEILKDNKVFEVDDRRLVSFVGNGGVLGKFINIEGSPIFHASGMDGFVEVLRDSPRIKLYRRYEVEILKANYNVALNTGNKNDTAKLKMKYLIFYNNRLHEFSGKRKELAAVFGEDAGSAEKFIKKEKLKFKQEEDYRKLVEFVDEW